MLRLHLQPEEPQCHDADTRPGEDDLKDLIYQRLMQPGRYETDPIDGCMVFCGAWTSRGTGRVRVGRRVYNVARVAAWVFFGLPLWSDEVAYHRCGCPACFAPDHVGFAPNRSIAFALRRLWRLGKTHLIPRRPPFAIAKRADTIRAAAAAGASLKTLATRFHATELEILAVFNDRSHHAVDRSSRNPAAGAATALAA